MSILTFHSTIPCGKKYKILSFYKIPEYLKKRKYKFANFCNNMYSYNMIHEGLNDFVRFR